MKYILNCKSLLETPQKKWWIEYVISISILWNGNAFDHEMIFVTNFIFGHDLKHLQFEFLHDAHFVIETFAHVNKIIPNYLSKWNKKKSPLAHWTMHTFTQNTGSTSSTYYRKYEISTYIVFVFFFQFLKLKCSKL